MTYFYSFCLKILLESGLYLPIARQNSLFKTLSAGGLAEMASYATIISELQFIIPFVYNHVKTL